MAIIESAGTTDVAQAVAAERRRLRVLTLNIQVGMQTAHYGHYVTGAWRHVLPSRNVRANLDRIADLAARFDLVALQEADAGSLRTAQLNQVEYLAHKAGFTHWRVAVNRNLGPFAQQFGGTADQFGAIQRTHLTPCLKPALRGGQRLVEVGLSGMGERADRLFRRRVQHGKARFASVAPASVDEKLGVRV